MINKNLIKLFDEEVCGNKNFSLKVLRGGEVNFHKELNKKLEQVDEIHQWEFLSLVFGLMKGISEHEIELIQGGVK